VFASGVMFTDDASILSQHEDEQGEESTTTDADSIELLRVLMADARGTRLLRLLQGSAAADRGRDQRDQSCRLFLGSTDVPESVAKVLDIISLSWIPPPPPPREMDTFDRINSKSSAELDPTDWGDVDVEKQLATAELPPSRTDDQQHTEQ